MSEEPPSSRENLVLLLSQHQESLFRYIYCLVPVEADARDIQQETSLALYRKWEQFDTSRPFLAWAFRFAYLQVLKHREKSARSPLTFDPDVLDLLAGEHERVADHLDRRLRLLDGCLQKLPASEKDLVTIPAGVEETMSFELMFADGFQALCRASYGNSFHQCTTLGPKGVVEILPGDKGSVFGQSGGNRPNPKRLVVNKREVPAEDTLQLAVVLDEFAKAITSRSPFKADGAMGLRDIRIVEAVYASARQGGVSVPIKS